MVTSKCERAAVPLIYGLRVVVRAGLMSRAEWYLSSEFIDFFDLLFEKTRIVMILNS